MSQSIRTRWLAVTVAVAASCARPGEREVESEARAMVEAHASQARGLVNDSKQGIGEESTFAELKKSIAEKGKAWQARIEAETQEATRGMGAADSATDQRKAAEVLSKGPDLEIVVGLVAARNPEIQASREGWRATLRRFEQASYLEDLVTRYRAFVRELDTRVGPQTHKEMLAETFPFPSALALKGQMVDLEARAANHEYRAVARRMQNAAARRCFQAIYLAEAAGVTERSVQLYSRMEEIARAQLQAGRAPQSDVLRAQSERVMAETGLETLRRERLNVQAELNAMMALPANTAWGAIRGGESRGGAPSFESALATARESKDELLKARAESRMADTAVRMAETMVYPRASGGMSQLSPSVGAEAGPTRQMMAAFPDRSEPDASAAGFGPNAAWIDELRTRAVQSKREEAAAEAAAEFAVKDALFKLDTAVREYAALRDSAAPKSAEALENIQERYAAGSASYVEYVEAARENLEIHLKREAARRDANIARLDLEDAMGRVGAAQAPETKGERR